MTVSHALAEPQKEPSKAQPSKVEDAKNDSSADTASEEESSNSNQATHAALNVARSQLVNLLKGPDGRIRMPIDVYYPSKTYKNLPKPLLKASGQGKLTTIEKGLSGRPTIFRATCPGFNQVTESQIQDTWCWAAAIRCVERYASANLPLSYDQESIVRRIHPMPQADETALSFQIVQALAMQQGETNSGTLEYVATLGTALDLAANHEGDNTYRDIVTTFLNQWVGVKEAVESIARGEPLLVAMRKDEYKHIYVLYAIDFIRIEKKQSDEFKLQAARKALEVDLDRALLNGKNNNPLGDLRNGVGGLGKGFGGLFKQNPQYAAVKLYLFDPHDSVAHQPNKMYISMDGQAFKDSMFFMVNRTAAMKIMEEATYSTNEMTSDASQLINH